MWDVRSAVGWNRSADGSVLDPWGCGRRLSGAASCSGGLLWLLRTVSPVCETGTTVLADRDDSTLRRTPKMARLEAVLMVAEGALSTRKLAQWATLADAAEARSLIEALNEQYDLAGSAFRIERVATGYQLLTRPVFSYWLNKLHQRQAELKLSSPAIETLTIVAYRQPITRADIEAVRGVQSSEMLKQLMERGLVRIGGEDDSLGRPYLYETTRKFLEMFGLRSLDDLPMADRLRKSQEQTPNDPEQNAETATEPLDGESPLSESSDESAEVAEPSGDESQSSAA